MKIRLCRLNYADVEYCVFGEEACNRDCSCCSLVSYCHDCRNNDIRLPEKDKKCMAFLNVE